MTNKEIGKRIQIARVNAGLNKKELAQKIKVADSTIKRYEDGEITKIKMPIIESIAYATIVNPMWIIGKSDDMEWKEYLEMQKESRKQYAEKWNIRFFDQKMLDSFTQLNDDNKKKSILYTENLLRNQILEDELIQQAKLLEEQISAKPKRNIIHLYAYMHKIAAAGTGFYFDDIPTDTIEAPYMEGADFIIGVNGDSMEPTYNDGDLVYVEKRQIVEIGDIGIFLVNGECYIKEAGENELISHNHDYPNIPGTEHIHCIGKVLGKVELS